MEKLLSMLKTIPEYSALLQAMENRQCAAITGIGQINRSHLIAGLKTHTDRPIVVICQDDISGKRLQEELHSFLGKQFPILPNALLARLGENYSFSMITPGAEESCVRFCTGWATREEDVDALLRDLDTLL